MQCSEYASAAVQPPGFSPEVYSTGLVNYVVEESFRSAARRMLEEHLISSENLRSSENRSIKGDSPFFDAQETLNYLATKASTFAVL